MSPELAELIERTAREVWEGARDPRHAKDGASSAAALRWAQFARGKIQRAVEAEIARRVAEATGAVETTDGEGTDGP